MKSLVRRIVSVSLMAALLMVVAGCGRAPRVNPPDRNADDKDVYPKGKPPENIPKEIMPKGVGGGS